MGNQEVRRFEGVKAFRELLRHFEMPVGKRPRIRIESKHLLDEIFFTDGAIVRNLVRKDEGKPYAHSIFHVALPLERKGCQPIRPRFVWPPEYCDGQGKDLFPLVAIEVQIS